MLEATIAIVDRRRERLQVAGTARLGLAGHREQTGERVPRLLLALDGVAELLVPGGWSTDGSRRIRRQAVDPAHRRPPTPSGPRRSSCSAAWPQEGPAHGVHLLLADRVSERRAAGLRCGTACPRASAPSCRSASRPTSTSPPTPGDAAFVDRSGDLDLLPDRVEPPARAGRHRSGAHRPGRRAGLHRHPAGVPGRSGRRAGPGPARAAGRRRRPPGRAAHARACCSASRSAWARRSRCCCAARRAPTCSIVGEDDGHGPGRALLGAGRGRRRSRPHARGVGARLHAVRLGPRRRARRGPRGRVRARRSLDLARSGRAARRPPPLPGQVPRPGAPTSCRTGWSTTRSTRRAACSS